MFLPPVPTALKDRAVAIWEEPLIIDTYMPGQPSRYPHYLDRRVYQGSSGRVYPLPFIDSIESTKAPRAWRAIHLENAYVRLVILPELGGRVYCGIDKTRDYAFFYLNHVIKPALVGLAGPWISGGVEFNWPQHHRPATHLPTAARAVDEPDGAVTAWCWDHDPFNRLLGVHGIRLRPDSALIECRVRLANRTEDVATFLWWANVAAPVGDSYQSFFPPDVTQVVDHARRAVTSFPAADGLYYGIDYPARVTPERPDADRLDWYRNIPVPTSYMCADSRGDFFGGYDHRVGAGFVHYADHRIAPGKKQWTWGNAPFGWAWDRNLTDADGPYVELMAGVFTDNQPDFSFLAPGEVKRFSQYWYPFQDIGPVQAASTEAAVRLADGELGVAVTRPRRGLSLSLADASGRQLWAATHDAVPGRPLTVRLPEVAGGGLLTVRDGAETLIEWRPEPPAPRRTAGAVEPPPPERILNHEQLYLTGLHLAQYRHATRAPEPYWREAARRDPGDARSHTALAAAAHKAGDAVGAEAFARAAVARLTSHNANPYDGEAHYRLGLALAAQDRSEEAREALAKAAWCEPWKTPALAALTRLELRAGRAEAALELASELAARAPLDANAQALKLVAGAAPSAAPSAEPGTAPSAAPSVAGSAEPSAAPGAVPAAAPGAAPSVAGSGARAGDDPAAFDWWLADLTAPLTSDQLRDAPIAMDLAHEYAAVGRPAEALRLANLALEIEVAWPVAGLPRIAPLAHYLAAEALDALGRAGEATAQREAAQTASDNWCFPGPLADYRLLERQRERDPGDGRAAKLAGHWLYAHGRRAAAMAAWRAADAAGAGDPVVWRCLGVGAFNEERDPHLAWAYYLRAVKAAPGDAELLSESDQLAARLGLTAAERLARLAARPEQVAARDDLSAAQADLLTAVGRPQEAAELLVKRDFHPWEGGEGVVLGVWERTQLALARAATAEARHGDALGHIEAALDAPANLGEARHTLAGAADLHLARGDALAALGRREEAEAAWEAAAAQRSDFQDMTTWGYSEKSYDAALALRRLGRAGEAAELLAGMERFADELGSGPAGIDYFATSLPTMLLFHDDLEAMRDQRAAKLRQLARAGRERA
ncbi:MAG: DUF5107 domain-containing protein [Bifidobacteriaceae bacterium]|nr:DUF5107 domain-containing protein [Bifidobacteriaceae bacterium]